MSNSAMAFVDEACTLKPDLWIVIADLYNHYKDWCEENGVDSVSRISSLKHWEIYHELN